MLRRLRSGIDVNALGDGTPLVSELVGTETDSRMLLSFRRAAPLAAGVDERPGRLRP
jgi:hypothetical protein